MTGIPGARSGLRRPDDVEPDHLCYNPPRYERVSQQARMLDTIAVVLSGICMLHCLALPIVLTAFPILNIRTLSENVFTY